MTLPTKIKRVLLEPDPRLRVLNVDVTEPWSDLEPWVRLMFKAMYRISVGVGLAAPQVGWNVRLFVMNAHRFNPDREGNRFEIRKDLVFWNPRIALSGEPLLMTEGCLSLPGVKGQVSRYPFVHLWAQSPKGRIEQDFEGLAAQIIQHEMDHLDGKLCIEHQQPVGKAAR